MGGGLAGCEAAWQLASRGIAVRVLEMKPGQRSPAHVSDDLAELVCSNSLGSDAGTTAGGLLKAELREMGSIVMRCAEECRVPAGGALAVDRARFARAVTEAVTSQGLVEVRQETVERVPEGPVVIVATGPMTAPPFADDLATVLDPGGGNAGLHYWDAISPIVEADSVDEEKSFTASRWEEGDGDYVNCPMDEAGYRAFVRGVKEAEKVALAEFEEERYYEGCLPIEVLAERGDDTLAFGPLKPAGLVDPATGRRPFAVLQLRREDLQGSAYNLVGCQTRMTQAEQRRVFRMVPALAEARFMRYGQIHRNTFVDSPRLLGPMLESRARPGLFVAGQLCGVEGYTESTAAGLIAAIAAARRARGLEPPEPPPGTTMCGGLLGHVAAGAPFQPSGAIWGLVPPGQGRGRRDRRRAAFERGVRDIRTWITEENIS